MGILIPVIRVMIQVMMGVVLDLKRKRRGRKRLLKKLKRRSERNSPPLAKGVRGERRRRKLSCLDSLRGQCLATSCGFKRKEERQLRKKIQRRQSLILPKERRKR